MKQESKHVRPALATFYPVTADRLRFTRILGLRAGLVWAHLGGRLSFWWRHKGVRPERGFCGCPINSTSKR
jgi:hypothetical protein